MGCTYVYIYTYIYILYIYIWNFGPGMLINHRTLGDPLAGETSCFNWSDSIDVPTRLISGIVFPLFLCPKNMLTNKQPLFLESNDVCLWCNKHVQSLSDGGPGIQGSLFTATRLKTRATEVPVDQSGNLNMGRFRKITCNDWIQKELRYV